MELWIDDLRKTSLTKTELCEQLVQQMGITQKESRELVDGFFDIVGAALRRGQPVKLAHFGTFNVRTKAARPGRNMRTAEQVEVQARRSVTFSTGPKLRSLLHPGADLAMEADAEAETEAENDADAGREVEMEMEVEVERERQPDMQREPWHDKPAPRQQQAPSPTGPRLPAQAALSEQATSEQATPAEAMPAQAMTAQAMTAQTINASF